MVTLKSGAWVTAKRPGTGKRIMARVVEERDSTKIGHVRIRFDNDLNDSIVKFDDLLLLNGEKPETIVDLTDEPAKPEQPGGESTIHPSLPRTNTLQDPFSTPPAAPVPQKPTLNENQTAAGPPVRNIFSTSNPEVAAKSWLLERPEVRAPIANPLQRTAQPVSRNLSQQASSSRQSNFNAHISRHHNVQKPSSSGFSLAAALQNIARHPSGNVHEDDTPIPRINQNSSDRKPKRQRKNYNNLAGNPVPQTAKPEIPKHSRRLEKRRLQRAMRPAERAENPNRLHTQSMAYQPSRKLGVPFIPSSGFPFTEQVLSEEDQEFWELLRNNSLCLTPISTSLQSAVLKTLHEPHTKRGRRKKQRPRRTDPMFHSDAKIQQIYPQQPELPSDQKDIPDCISHNLHLGAVPEAVGSPLATVQRPRIYTCTSSAVCQYSEQQPFNPPPAVQCRKCGLWTHIACARLDLSFLSTNVSDYYMCAQCVDGVTTFPLPVQSTSGSAAGSLVDLMEDVSIANECDVSPSHRSKLSREARKPLSPQEVSARRKNVELLRQGLLRPSIGLRGEFLDTVLEAKTHVRSEPVI